MPQPARPDAPPPAVNPLPPVVAALFLVIVGVEAAFALGARGLLGGPQAVGWRLDAVQDYAFSGQILAWMLETGQTPMAHVIRFFSYPFVHGGFTHALFAGVMLLALGKIVGEVLGGLRTLALFSGSGVVAALAYAATGASAPLFGAFPPVYGLIGGFTDLLWLRLGQMGAQQARAFSLIGVLMGIQLLFAVILGGDLSWVADLAGFCAGFALCLLLVPGGLARMLEKLRRD